MARKRFRNVPPSQHVNTYAEQDRVEAESKIDADSSAPWRIRFGMRGLLMLMLFCSVLFAGFGYLLHAVRGGGRGFQLAFVLFTLVGPMALLILFRIIAWLLQWTHRKADPGGDASDEA